MHALLTAALSLMISQSSTETPAPRPEGPAAPDSECFVDAGPGLAPLNVEWPRGLPEGIMSDAGTMLPKPLDEEMRRRLRCLWRWPLAAQAIIDTQAELCAARIKDRNDKIAELRDDLAAVQPQPPTSWPTWAVVLGTGVGLVVGALATYGVISLARR